MNFADYKKTRARTAQKPQVVKERRPKLTTQEERFLYSLHLKTIELRTLIATMKAELPREVLELLLVEYNMRLKKARKNFEENNFKEEWYELD